MITRGRADVRVAVIDEGVDTDHPALKASVVDQKDFVDGNGDARPDGNDAHGTACAGIIVSRDDTYPGIAPECSPGGGFNRQGRQPGELDLRRLRHGRCNRLGMARGQGRRPL